MNRRSVREYIEYWEGVSMKGKDLGTLTLYTILEDLQWSHGDQDALCTGLFNIIHSPPHYRTLSELKGRQAVIMLNFLQKLMDSPRLNSRFRNPFMGALLRLSRKSGEFPQGLVRCDVELNRGNAFAGGASGELYTGRLHRRVVAVKIFKFYQSSNFANHLKAVSREALIWRQLSHPNILRFLCIYRDPDNTQQRFGLVSPWMKHGNIQSFLKQEPNSDRLSLIAGIVAGLAYLHSLKPATIHGDLKAVNVLITSAKTACLADFGLARVRNPEIVSFSSSSTEQGRGTLRWMAPELLNYEEEAGVHITASTDMFAFGCVCYEIFSGHVPFYNITSDFAVVKKITDGVRPDRPDRSFPSNRACTQLGLTDHLWSIILACWNIQPESRPTAKDIIARLSLSPTPTTVLPLKKIMDGPRSNKKANVFEDFLNDKKGSNNLQAPEGEAKGINHSLNTLQKHIRSLRGSSKATLPDLDGLSSNDQVVIAVMGGARKSPFVAAAAGGDYGIQSYTNETKIITFDYPGKGNIGIYWD